MKTQELQRRINHLARKLGGTTAELVKTTKSKVRFTVNQQTYWTPKDCLQENPIIPLIFHGETNEEVQVKGNYTGEENEENYSNANGKTGTSAERTSAR